MTDDRQSIHSDIDARRAGRRGGAGGDDRQNIHSDIDAAEAHLRNRIALPADVSEEVRYASIARMINKVGSKLAMNTANPSNTLNALREIESLAGINNRRASTTWFAFHAMTHGAAREVLMSNEAAACPIVNAIASAFGANIVKKSKSPMFELSFEGDTYNRTHNESVVLGDKELSFQIMDGKINVDLSRHETEDFITQIRAAQAALRKHIGMLPVTNTKPRIALIRGDSTFAPYRINRIEIHGAIEHPTPIVESVALASVAPPAVSFMPMVNLDAVRAGAISDIQLEAVTYAVQAHNSYLPKDPLDMSHVPARRGFLIGHGTGVGKGRIIAGVIADSWIRGRRRHIWISESARLIEDARHDWAALGGNPENVIDIRDYPSDETINAEDGILFMTYAALRADNNGNQRWRQAATWFADTSTQEGVIAFDEAQNLRNSTSHEDGGEKLSLQGRRALEMQRKLPEARVLYVSATSASDIPSMGFAERLGLWGPGSAFPDLSSFVQAMKEGGVNALEMVARDMKAMGLYLAGNLSFEGVTYRRLPIAMNDKSKRIQNECSALWSQLINELKGAQNRTGLMTALNFINSKKTSANGKKVTGVTIKTDYAQRFSIAQIRMERARFFQALLASLKMPAVLDEIKNDIANGDAAIIQLNNTFSATAERSMDDVGDDAALVDATPRDIMISYLNNHFPVIKCEVVKKGMFYSIEPVINPKTGEPEICTISAATRDRMLDRIANLDLPNGPLEQLFSAFPAEWIAEATGRKRRLVTDPSGLRRIEDRENKDATTDIQDFMADRRKILVFSAAGAVGATYSAAMTCANQRIRRHYVLQPGWRADMAIQGMGRSHRSNQRQAPEYILPMTDLWADLRMVSRIASRMRALGALTRGMRSAASQGFFTDLENYENEFAQNAWVNFLKKVSAGNVPGMKLNTIENETTLVVMDEHGKLVGNREIPNVSRFLNALSAMTVTNQERFGQHFSEALDILRLEAIRNGDYDRGIESIEADALIKVSDNVIYHDPISGADTRLVEILQVRTTKPTPFRVAEDMVARRGAARAAQNYITGRVTLLSFPILPRGRAPSGTDSVLMVTPSGAREISRSDAVRIGFKVISLDEAEALWDAEIEESGSSEEETITMVTGAMLPIWDKMPRTRAQVVRMITDSGEPLLGRLVPSSYATKIKDRFAAIQSGGANVDLVIETLNSGGMATLANGWVIEASYRTSKSKERSSCLLMSQTDLMGHKKLVEAINAKERKLGFNHKTAYLMLPEEKTMKADAIAKILAISPAVALTGL